MAKQTTSRTRAIPISLEDLRAIRYSLLIPSIFFDEPLRVRVPHLGEDFEVGLGLGAFSWNMFAKGESCTACGNCCTNLIRWVWLWHPNDAQPSGLPQVELGVNGTALRYSYHIEAPEAGVRTSCSYLDPLTLDGVHQVEGHGIPMHVCSLHGNDDPLLQVEGIRDINRTYDEDLKPVHCRMDPFLRPRERTYREHGTVVVLERNLPGRNFRWPKCPVDLSKVPATERVFRSDRRNLGQIASNYGSLPGAQFERGLAVWESFAAHSMAGRPPASTVFLKEWF